MIEKMPELRDQLSEAFDILDAGYSPLNSYGDWEEDDEFGWWSAKFDQIGKLIENPDEAFVSEVVRVHEEPLTPEEIIEWTSPRPDTPSAESRRQSACVVLLIAALRKNPSLAPFLDEWMGDPRRHKMLSRICVLALPGKYHPDVEDRLYRFMDLLDPSTDSE